MLLGAGVVLLPLRHPASWRSRRASLDYLSRGTAAARGRRGRRGGEGLRGGGRRPARSVVARADEGIAALRALFAPGPASFAGRFYRFDGRRDRAPLAPAPGGPPILVGGRSEAAQRRAGRLGDGWLPYLVSPRRFAAGIENVRAHAVAAGRDPEALEHVLVTFRTRRRRRRAGARERPGRTSRTATGCASSRTTSSTSASRARRRSALRACARTPRRASTHVSFNPAADDDLLEQVERLRAVADLAREALA